MATEPMEFILQPSTFNFPDHTPVIGTGRPGHGRSHEAASEIAPWDFGLWTLDLGLAPAEPTAANHHSPSPPVHRAIGSKSSPRDTLLEASIRSDLLTCTIPQKS